MASRFAENLSFGITSGLRILFGKRPDVIYSNTWPVIATGIVAMVAKLRRVPLVLRVQDVYPESLDSQRQISTKNWIYRLLRQCDRAIAQSSEQIAVISFLFKHIYENDRGVPPEKLHVIPNWRSDDLVGSDSTSAVTFRRKLDVPEDAFLAVYAGNVGAASNAVMLVDAFAKLNDRRNIYLVIAGDGSQLDLCRQKVERQNLDRVVIHTPWLTEETESVLKMADVLLLPTVGNQSLNSIPSKLIAYLLTGRPVIAAVLPESDIASAILESGSGWIIKPDSADLMAKMIVKASELAKEALINMGIMGREFARQCYTPDFNLPRIVDLVENAAKARNKATNTIRG